VRKHLVAWGRRLGVLPAHSTSTPTRDLLTRLGHPPTARLLMIHADDVAMTPGVTRATFRGLREGVAQSASILAVGDAMDGLAADAGSVAELDLGVHLSLTSESAAMRWRPVLPASEVPSLVDDEGYLPLKVSPSIVADEVQAELEAQVARVRQAGVDPSHLDCHQFSLYVSGPQVFGAWLRAAARTGVPLPVLLPFAARFDYLRRGLTQDHLPVEAVRIVNETVSPEAWTDFYRRLIPALPAGLTMLFVHLGEDTPDERERFRAAREWGADWRARDAAALASSGFRQAVADSGIQLVDWRDLRSTP
jgi:hypothetical protein